MYVRAMLALLVCMGLAAPAHAQAPRNMVVAANPVAAAAGIAMLKRGGSVVDAAIAVQMALAVVEPQSSGLGGGSLLMIWDPATARITALDGLVAAPAHVTASLRTDVDGNLLPLLEVAHSARAVGVPGTVRVLALAHARFGKLPWASLFEPAIAAARGGFPMSPYLHDSLAALPQLAAYAPVRRVFFDEQGHPWPVGTTLHNPALADALSKVAADPDAVNHGALTADILAALASGKHPSLITARDMADYTAVERQAICRPFMQWRVCAFPPPSFGGVSVQQQLAMLADRGIAAQAPGSVQADHLLIETSRLAQADRRAYVGDPDHVAVPVDALLNPAYLRQRAAAITDTAIVTPRAGELPGVTPAGPAHEPGSTETTQIAIVDAQGNALSMTTTINLNFGAWLMPHGLFLNDALTNFSAPTRGGLPAANAMGPRRRPVTSMSPSLVFDGSGRLVLVTGSAGGGYIVDYIAQAIVATLAWGLTPSAALALPHVAGNTGRSQVEAGAVNRDIVARLTAMGHHLEQVEMHSGAAALKVTPDGLVGAADPRRDGVALGF
jgi:gamma-glutamyltranspeptidase/glutathione hydrolase